MHHKNQLLKCHYDIDWSSFNINLPSVSDALNGNRKIHLNFVMNIENPIPFNLEVKNSVLLIKHYGTLVNRTEISNFQVASRQSLTQPMTVKTDIKGMDLKNWRDLSSGWEIQLELMLLPGIPLAIDLIDETNKSFVKTKRDD